MLNVLPEPAATIVAIAAFTGVRRGELRGLLWENYDGEQALVSQSFWRGHRLDPKTRQSKAPVPVIAQLARRLDWHRQVSGNPANGLMFPGPVGKPINLDALAADVIVPVLTKAGVQWHGWHAYRRGLATNPHRLGVPDKIIQRSGTRTWRSRRAATSRLQTPTLRRQCSNLGDLSNMHLICTSQVRETAVHVISRRTA